MSSKKKQKTTEKSDLEAQSADNVLLTDSATASKVSVADSETAPLKQGKF